MVLTSGIESPVIMVGIQLGDLTLERIVTLRRDELRGVSDLAVDVGVSRATVRARMERLERSGEIIGIHGTRRRGRSAYPPNHARRDQVPRRRPADPGTGWLSPSFQHVHDQRPLGSPVRTWDDFIDRSRRCVAAHPTIAGITGCETSLLLATPHTTRAR